MNNWVMLMGLVIVLVRLSCGLAWIFVILYLQPRMKEGVVGDLKILVPFELSVVWTP